VNTLGSYTCECDFGYQLDKDNRSCVCKYYFELCVNELNVEIGGVRSEGRKRREGRE